MTNKLFLLSFFTILLASSCRKDIVKTSPLPTDPSSGIRYIDLDDQEAKPRKPRSIDLNDDGIVDFSFSTLLVGDPILKHDKLQFYVYSRVNTFLLVNEQEESPILNASDKIMLQVPNYNWYEIAAIVLTEKISSEVEPPYWNGLWRNADHHFLPIQIKHNKQSFLGWIELSFDTTNERIILHRAAISTQPNQEILAGN